MNGIEKAVKSYLDSQNWRYKYDEEDHEFSLGMSLENNDVDSCIIVVHVRDDEDMSCRAIYEFKIPEKKRAIISDYITRVNYGMFLGCFQMDLRDGEIFYKTSSVFSDGAPLNDEIRRIVQVTIHMAEKYGDGFYDVMYKGKSPAETVQAIEADD
ncbi:MAG: YbjN domain-containing protein [Oscillospiraceae bacterium]|jgi:hypothetical protein|nr:YbjN domain-containing protein [Oscillospiraceae bacterium]